MTARRRRLLLATVVAIGFAAPLAPASSDAHTCAEVRVYKGGTTTSVLSCHAPPGHSGDVCQRPEVTHNGEGAGATLCIFVPVQPPES